MSMIGSSPILAASSVLSISSSGHCTCSQGFRPFVLDVTHDRVHADRRFGAVWHVAEQEAFAAYREWLDAMLGQVGYRQGFFANLPMSRRGHRRYRPTFRPPSLRAAIRLGNACGLTRFRLCISAWRSPASARISRRETCRRREFGGRSPC